LLSLHQKRNKRIKYIGSAIVQIQELLSSFTSVTSSVNESKDEDLAGFADDPRHQAIIQEFKDFLVEATKLKDEAFIIYCVFLNKK